MNSPDSKNPQPENDPAGSTSPASKLPPSDDWDHVELPGNLAALPRVGEMIADGTESSLAEQRPDVSRRKASPAARLANSKQTNFLLLSVQCGPHQGEGRVIPAGQSLVVGRAADVQLRLINELSLSRNHFRIDSTPAGWRLVDLNSTNGTMVNGSKVTEVDLKHGDRIECGQTIFNVGIANKFVSDDEITVQIALPNQSPTSSDADSQPTHRFVHKPKSQ